MYFKWILIVFLSLSTNVIFSKVTPFNNGYLKVSKMHDIYFEEYGNPKGKPLFVLHGGPGFGFKKSVMKYFNLNNFRVILHDQRGCGRSKPYGEIRENTAALLVKDIEKLKVSLKIEKITIYGGSWGATLALAYAKKYPSSVKALVLRGIFLGSKKEIDNFYYNIPKLFFPDRYFKLISEIKEAKRSNLADFLYREILKEEKNGKGKYTRLWMNYEFGIATLYTSSNSIMKNVDKNNYYAAALLENYYMANGCFLKEGQLLKNIARIKNIPIYIINGRYDLLSPPIHAYNLHKSLSNSKLYIIERTGHYSEKGDMVNTIVKIIKELE